MLFPIPQRMLWRLQCNEATRSYFWNSEERIPAHNHFFDWQQTCLVAWKSIWQLIGKSMLYLPLRWPGHVHPLKCSFNIRGWFEVPPTLSVWTRKIFGKYTCSTIGWKASTPFLMGPGETEVCRIISPRHITDNFIRKEAKEIPCHSFP